MDTNRTKRFSTFQGAPRPTSALPPTCKRAGATPSKTEANGSQQSQPKPKLTAQQQLDILERIEIGDFIMGAGVKQFYAQPCSPVAASGPGSTRKNLLSEFDKLQISGASTTGPTLSSTKLSEVTDKDDANDEMNPCINLMDYGIHEQNPDAYPCMEKMDRIIVHYQINVKDLMTLCRIRNEEAFAQLIPPQQLINIFYRMEEITLTVKKFMKKTEMERAKMFLPPGTFGRGKDDGKYQKAKSEMRVDVQDQKDFFDALEKVPGWMDHIHGLLKKLDEKCSEERTSKLKEVIAKMFKLVDALEDGLIRMETNDAAHVDLCNKIWDCEEDDATASTTSSEYSPISVVTP